MTTPAPSRVLVLTSDVLGAKMAGPAIRSWEIAKSLSRAVEEVRLASTQAAELTHPEFAVAFADEDRLRDWVDWADVLVVQGDLLSSFPWMCDADVVIVADLYDPMHLEALEIGREHLPHERMDLLLRMTEALNVQIERADFMICASEKQRDFWLGQLGALCRINVYTYDTDPSLRSLIDVAPFGVSEQAPVQTRHAIKGEVPGIGPEDDLIIWGGGVYNWFDPVTLVRAVARLVERRPALKLYFLGMGHPNPLVPAMRTAAETRTLSDSLGLTGQHVFFNTEWVDYDDRVNYLLDADLGVSTHFDHIETAFSFRTRILDYVWAGLPVVATGGDTFATIIGEHELGLVVDPEDVDGLAEAIERVLYSSERERMAGNARRFAQTMRWSRVLDPLIAFCRDPRHASDYPDKVVSPRNRERMGLESRIGSLEQQVQNLRGHVEALESSTSWKLTKPLRSAMGRLSGRR